MLGVIGGVSYISTLEYYRQLNESWSQAWRDPQASAPLLIHSLDFRSVVRSQKTGDWLSLQKEIFDSVAMLSRAGCVAVLIASNTLHKFARSIESHQRQAHCPLLHIADAVADRCLEASRSRVALLGTTITMREPFYRDRLLQRGVTDVLTPDVSDQQRLHEIIFSKLIAGQVESQDQMWFHELIDKLKAQGAEAVIAGCTELFLLVGERVPALPVIDSVKAHTDRAVDFLVEKSNI